MSEVRYSEGKQQTSKNRLRSTTLTPRQLVRSNFSNLVQASIMENSPVPRASHDVRMAYDNMDGFLTSELSAADCQCP